MCLSCYSFQYPKELLNLTPLSEETLFEFKLSRLKLSMFLFQRF